MLRVWTGIYLLNGDCVSRDAGRQRRDAGRQRCRCSFPDRARHATLGPRVSEILGNNAGGKGGIFYEMARLRDLKWV